MPCAPPPWADPTTRCSTWNISAPLNPRVEGSLPPTSCPTNPAAVDGASDVPRGTWSIATRRSDLRQQRMELTAGRDPDVARKTDPAAPHGSRSVAANRQRILAEMPTTVAHARRERSDHPQWPRRCSTEPVGYPHGPVDNPKRGSRTLKGVRGAPCEREQHETDQCSSTEVGPGVTEHGAPPRRATVTLAEPTQVPAERSDLPRRSRSPRSTPTYFHGCASSNDLHAYCPGTGQPPRGSTSTTARPRAGSP